MSIWKTVNLLTAAKLCIAANWKKKAAAPTVSGRHCKNGEIAIAPKLTYDRRLHRGQPRFLERWTLVVIRSQSAIFPLCCDDLEYVYNFCSECVHIVTI